MATLGFKELLDEKIAGYIITSYHFPKDPNFNFKEFYSRLNDKGELGRSRLKCSPCLRIVYLLFTYWLQMFLQGMKEGRKCLFNDAINTFHLRLYSVRHMVKDHSYSERGN